MSKRASYLVRIFSAAGFSAVALSGCSSIDGVNDLSFHEPGPEMGGGLDLVADGSYFTNKEKALRLKGHKEYCDIYPNKCRPYEQPYQMVPLNDHNMAILRDTNDYVNNTIIDAVDRDLYGKEDVWRSFQLNSEQRFYGDCEDHALTKRDMLIEAGFPASALLLAHVKDNIGGHMVLSVKTDKGTLILDNQFAEIKPVSKTLAPFSSNPYQYLKIQSAEDAAIWHKVSIVLPNNVRKEMALSLDLSGEKLRSSVQPF